MKNAQGVLFFVVLFILIPFVAAQPPEQQPPADSLTAALCNNQEQIFSKRTGNYRIDYYMGETQLNMKTMSGFLSLNTASEPFYRQYRRHRGAGIFTMIGGVGLIVANGYITKPDFPVYTLTGIATLVWGFKVFICANDKFRLSIHAYNKNICRIK